MYRVLPVARFDCSSPSSLPFAFYHPRLLSSAAVMALLHPLPLRRRPRRAVLPRGWSRRRWIAAGMIPLVPATSAIAVASAGEPAAQEAMVAGALPEVDEPVIPLEIDAPPAAADEAVPEAPPAPAGGETVARDLGGGEASWYGMRFAGRPTASGEAFNPARMTAAHRSLPFGSRVRVTHRGNGRSVIVRINDRGPYHGGRVIDLSEAAARSIGLARAGTGDVRLELLR